MGRAGRNKNHHRTPRPASSPVPSAGSYESIETNSRETTQPIKRKTRFLNSLAGGLKLIKFEILTAFLTLVLALGQYFQSGIASRISITETWREGYTEDTRNRVTKFRYLYHKKWKQKDQHGADQSVDMLVNPENLFNERLKDDANIRELISDEISLDSANGSREDYTKAVLKYRNAIMECLNTAEAVKAVIESRPLPFRRHLLYSDTLEGRYRDIITELTNDLRIFIDKYRVLNPRPAEQKKTPAWYVLTDEESNKNDYIFAGSVVFALILSLVGIYLVKRRVSIRE